MDPREKLRESFVEHYPGQSVISRKMAILDIKLVGTPCFRRIRIPSHYSLMQLHWVIQTLFSWKDAHLHVFETEDGLSLDILIFRNTVFWCPKVTGNNRPKPQWSGIFPLAKCLKKARPSNMFMT